VSLSEGDTISASDLGIARQKRQAPPQVAEPIRDGVVIDFSRSFVQAKRETIAAFEIGYLTQLMHDCGGNVSRAARRAQKERRDFRRLLHKHRLDPRAFEPR
jgi:DNA-binding NtrC family response regulator